MRGRATDEEEDDSLADFWIQDVSPKGRKVIAVYRRLQGLSAEQQAEVSEAMKELDGEQKQMLSSILTARREGDREITSSEPENGDSPQRQSQDTSQDL